ncbi:MAG: hypothetical protein FGM32_11385 [Candidatus Kapabacteria bacterium]|nr:hypothetical protein [Candidatus Kapabacteria bacterium]
MDQYSVTMVARHGRNGPIVESLRRSYLFVNGVKRGLYYGFPFRNASDQIALPIGTSTLEIGFLGPGKSIERTQFVLAPRLLYKRTYVASKTSGLVVTISPALGQDEIIEMNVYKSVGTFKRIVSRVFQGVGLSTMNVAAAEYVDQILDDKELTVELNRKTVVFRNVLFSVSARATTCCLLGLRAEDDLMRQQGVVASWRRGVDA